MLGIIKKIFKYFGIRSFKIIYPTFIRTHLEFSSSIWNALNKDDIKRIEGVQRRATKLVRELRGLRYEERMEMLGITTLEIRRIRGDLIILYRILKGIDSVDLSMGFKESTSTRSHNLQIKIDKKVKSPLRGKFLPQRLGNVWNSLPSYIVDSPTLNTFKSRLDEYMSSEDWKRSIYNRFG